MDYDIAPLPSPDGMTVRPVAVYRAAMSVNSKAKNFKEGAQAFLAYDSVLRMGKAERSSAQAAPRSKVLRLVQTNRRFDCMNG